MTDGAEREVNPGAQESNLLGQITAQLREIERRSGIDRTLAIGELILKQFFDTSPAAWRDRRRNKNHSLRKLARREDCPFSKSTLHEAVCVCTSH